MSPLKKTSLSQSKPFQPRPRGPVQPWRSTQPWNPFEARDRQPAAECAQAKCKFSNFDDGEEGIRGDAILVSKGSHPFEETDVEKIT